MNYRNSIKHFFSNFPEHKIPTLYRRIFSPTSQPASQPATHESKHTDTNTIYMRPYHFSTIYQEFYHKNRI